MYQPLHLTPTSLPKLNLTQNMHANSVSFAPQTPYFNHEPTPCTLKLSSSPSICCQHISPDTIALIRHTTNFSHQDRDHPIYPQLVAIHTQHANSSAPNFHKAIIKTSLSTPILPTLTHSPQLVSTHTLLPTICLPSSCYLI